MCMMTNNAFAKVSYIQRFIIRLIGNDMCLGWKKSKLSFFFTLTSFSSSLISKAIEWKFSIEKNATCFSTLLSNTSVNKSSSEVTRRKSISSSFRSSMPPLPGVSACYSNDSYSHHATSFLTLLHDWLFVCRVYWRQFDIDRQWRWSRK